VSVVVCIALVREGETPDYWSGSIGRDAVGSHIYADHWTTELPYVCQYHSKSLSVSLSVSRLSVNRLMMLLIIDRHNRCDFFASSCLRLLMIKLLGSKFDKCIQTVRLTNSSGSKKRLKTGDAMLQSPCSLLGCQSILGLPINLWNFQTCKFHHGASKFLILKRFDRQISHFLIPLSDSSLICTMAPVPEQWLDILDTIIVVTFLTFNKVILFTVTIFLLHRATAPPCSNVKPPLLTA